MDRCTQSDSLVKTEIARNLKLGPDASVEQVAAARNAFIKARLQQDFLDGCVCLLRTLVLVFAWLCICSVQQDFLDGCARLLRTCALACMCVLLLCKGHLLMAMAPKYGTYFLEKAVISYSFKRQPCCK